jgi:hypothetical protein
MATGEQLFDRNKSGHSPIFAHPEKFAPEPLLIAGVVIRTKSRSA